MSWSLNLGHLTPQSKFSDNWIYFLFWILQLNEVFLGRFFRDEGLYGINLLKSDKEKADATWGKGNLSIRTDGYLIISPMWLRNILKEIRSKQELYLKKGDIYLT